MKTPYTHKINSKTTGLLFITIFFLLLSLSVALKYYFDDFPILASVFSFTIFPSVIMLFFYIYFLSPQKSLVVSEKGLTICGFSPQPLLIPWHNINWLGQFPTENYFTKNQLPTSTILTGIDGDPLFAIYLKNSSSYSELLTSQKNKHLNNILTKDYWKKISGFSAQDNQLPDITIHLGSTNANKAQERLKSSIRKYAPHLLSENNQPDYKDGSFPPPAYKYISVELQKDYNKLLDVNKNIDELMNEIENTVTDKDKDLAKFAIAVYFEYSTWKNYSRASKLLRKMFYGLLILLSCTLLLLFIFSFGLIKVVVGIILAFFYWLWIKSSWRQVLLPKSLSSVLNKLDIYSHIDLPTIFLWLIPFIFGGVIIFILVSVSPSITEFGAPPQLWIISSTASIFVGALLSLLFVWNANEHLKKTEEAYPIFKSIFSELSNWRDSARQLATKAYEKNIGINVTDKSDKTIYMSKTNFFQSIIHGHKMKWVIIAIIAIFLIVATVSTNRIVYVSDKDLGEIAPVFPSPPVDTSVDGKSPIRLKDAGLYPMVLLEFNDNSNTDSLMGNPADCQPEHFDPKTTHFTKVKISGSLSELYLIEGYSNYPTMMIDGWEREGEDKIILPNPYTTTVYHFGCSSNMSYVIDLYKNNIRQNLYNHVLHYDFSDDGKYLYLVMNTNSGTSWIKERKIIDLEKQTEAPIANRECVSDLTGLWNQDRLLTYTQSHDTDYTTDVCVWNSAGVTL